MSVVRIAERQEEPRRGVGRGHHGALQPGRLFVQRDALGHDAGGRLVCVALHVAVFAAITQCVIWGAPFVGSIQTFQLPPDTQSVQNVAGVRIVFEVKMNEFTPQNTPIILEELSVDICRDGDGKLIAQVEYPKT